MDFKCDELILGKKDADSRALTQDIAAYQLLGTAILGIIVKTWPGLAILTIGGC
ncbi:hypothetical protein NUK31_21675 [Aeromonas caviae]|jgi:hypothetical protein|uniref:hypothetical protein n=1 Tax=Aeromonas TaxID=642 RepID=UPI001FF1DCB3|nr:MULTISPECIES: hypothetical protein [Aeromonas]MCR3895571.1 hypothetical protein [Aeromonas caviae]UOV90302.1 hypothetical protein MUW98_13645 [Aeromonas hydrophila]